MDKTFKCDYEIVLVENGSKDSSWAICEKLYQHRPAKISIYRNKAASFGRALRFGLNRAKHKTLVVFNVDFWNINFLVQALELIPTCDIVVASKTLIAAQDKRPLYRQQLSYWFNVLLRIVYNFPGTDTHGLKVINGETVMPLLKNCYDLSELLDTQLVLRACRKGLVYAELPICVEEVRPSRYSHLRRTVLVLKDLASIFKYRYL